MSMLDPRALGGALGRFSPPNMSRAAPGVQAMQPLPQMGSGIHNSRPTGPAGAVDFGVKSGPWAANEPGQWVSGFNPGQQVPTMRFNPTSPNASAKSGGDGDLNGLHMAAIAEALGRGNWGNAQRPSLMDMFEDRGGGTYGFKTVEGTDVPRAVNGLDLLVNAPGGGMRTFEDAGMDGDAITRHIVRQLSAVDMSP